MDCKMSKSAYIVSGIGLVMFILGACALDSTGVYYTAAVVMMLIGGVIFWIGMKIQERFEAGRTKK